MPAIGPVDRTATRGAAYAAAVAGGCLYAFGFLGWGVWPCLGVFLVPLWWALARYVARPREAIVVGLLFGAAAFALGHLWLLSLIGPFLDGAIGTGLVLWGLYGIWFAAGFGVVGWLVHVVRTRGRSPRVAAIAPVVLAEWLQPQVFPLYAGNGLVAVPLLAQTADLGGPLLLTALVAGANLVLFETVAAYEERRPWPLSTWLVGTGVAMSVVGYGWVRTAGVEQDAVRAHGVRVGVVQANLAVRGGDGSGGESHRRYLEQTRALLAEGPVDLVVWPESAYARGIRRPLPVASAPIVRELTVPILFGATSVSEVDGRKAKSNSAVLAGADGMIREAYDKNLLIPLAESVPFHGAIPGLASWFPHAEDFRAADTLGALTFETWRIATPICYEAIRPELVRRMMNATSPHLVVTLANDAWFGDSQEPWLHLGLAQLRAIEHRRWLVRATNTGVSAVVDPAGRLVARMGLDVAENLHGTVYPRDERTVYARFGDWPGWVALVVVGLALGRRGAAGGADGDRVPELDDRAGWN